MSTTVAAFMQSPSHPLEVRLTRTRTRLLILATAAALGALTVAAPAHAAVPDAFGFVLWNGSSVVPSGTYPAGSTAGPIVPGRYKVVFAGQAATGGVVHVTAVNGAPHWCQVDGFGPSGANEVAQVSCYKAGGALDFSGFSVIFDRSSGPVTSAAGRFGYVDSTPSGGIVSQFNSSGAVNSVAHVGIGQWIVKLPGLGTPGPIDGSAQATAVNPSVPARCKVGKWASGPAGQQVLVLCFDATGAPFDTRFTMTYQYQRALYGPALPPKDFGYLFNVPPVGPPSTNFNSLTGPGTNTLTVAGVGLSLVRFPAIGVVPDDIQVTATGGTSDFCGLNTTWGHLGGDTVVRDVNCFTNAGAPVNSGFLVSDNSAF
jgi:hypothetical protein